MDTPDDDHQIARSLATWLAAVTFADLRTDQATVRLLEEVAQWGETQGWRVYRRAASVFPLPPPLRGVSVVDIACARPHAAPVVIEVDRLERRRTVDKLLAEAAAGRLAILVRWGSGPFVAPPPPVHLVTRETAGTGGHWHTVADRPAPRHSGAVAAEPEELPWEGKPRVSLGSGRHPASWWSQFHEVSDRFDAASVTEMLADQIIPKIVSPLLRREAEIATEVMVRHLNRPSSPELAERARKATARLVATVKRLDERATGGDLTTAETASLVHVLRGRYAEAASEAEPFVGTIPLLKAFVAALRLEYFDIALTVKLIGAGQGPADAVRTGLLVGRYGWWPEWLLTVVADRAVAGTVEPGLIAALDRCAYAELSPAQSKIARRLLGGDQGMIEASAARLEDLGESGAADRLRRGDLTAVALAARLIPL